MVRGIVLGVAMNKTLSLVLHIISAVLSVILSIALLFSLLGATLIGVGRAYLTSEQFNSQINNTHLPSLTFIQKGEKITLGEYANAFAEKYAEEYIEENTKTPSFTLGDFSFSDLGNALGNLFGDVSSSIIDYAVDKFLNSQVIETIIKNEIHLIIDYFLYSDVNEAKLRIENGVTLQENESLNPENANSFNEEMSIKIKLFVFEFIEDITGVSTDKIIVLLSEETATKLKNISICLAVALFIVNIRRIYNIFLYFSAILLSYSGVITLIQNNFEQFHIGKQDLVSYQFIKPLMDCYSPYSHNALILGITLLIIFIISIVIVILIKKKASRLAFPLRGRCHEVTDEV